MGEEAGEGVAGALLVLLWIMRHGIDRDVGTAWVESLGVDRARHSCRNSAGGALDGAMLYNM